MNVSKATNPRLLTQLCCPREMEINSRIPALAEFPMINVVHPAYHCFPNGGHGSFFESGNLRLSCVRVLATSVHWLDWNIMERELHRTFSWIGDCCLKLANKYPRGSSLREVVTNFNCTGSRAGYNGPQATGLQEQSVSRSSYLTDVRGTDLRPLVSFHRSHCC